VGLVLAACASGGQPTLVIYTAPPAAASLQPTPIPSLVAMPAPTPTPKPTATPKPTLRPATLKFGTLGYTASGCWDSNYTDAEGHGISGAMVYFSVTVKNTGQVKSGVIALHIESTDWFSTTPTLFKANWSGVSYSGDDTSADITGPQLGPGKSTTLRWSLLFQTPFDVHYTVDAGDAAHWSMWTSVQVCF
jgi:hypothetical protein